MSVLLFNVSKLAASRKQHIVEKVSYSNGQQTGEKAVPLAGKHGQVGPTCWYYVAKMALRFHGMAANVGDQQFENLKALSQLRKVLSELHNVYNVDVAKTGQVHSLGSSAYQESRSTVSQSLYVKYRVLSERLRVMDEHTQALTRKPSVPQKELKKLVDKEAALAKELSGLEKYSSMLTSPTKDRPIQDLKRKQIYIYQAITDLEKLTDDKLNRGEILTAFFSDTTFRRLDAAQHAPANLAALETTLRLQGPLYAGGEFLATKAETGNNPNINPNKELNIKLFTSSAFSTARHAILIVGVDAGRHLGSGGAVYYKEPNNTENLFEMTFEDFKRNLREQNVGNDKVLFFAVKCGTSQPCPHAKSSIVKGYDKA